MLCKNCGNQLREGAKFCHKCGTSVPKSENYQNNVSRSQAEPLKQAQEANQMPTQQVVYQPVYQTQPRPYYAPGTHPYHRLGGFLMFTVVISYISGVSSLVSMISTIISYSGLMKNLGSWLPGGFQAWFFFNIAVSSILQLSAGIISISIANKIRRKDSNFLLFIQSSTLALTITMIIWFIISFIWLKQYDIYGVIKWGSLMGTLVAMVIGLILGVILGSIYYGCSVRVRTYMGSDDYLKQSVFNKNSHPIPADGSDQPGVVSYDKAVRFNPEKQWYCTQCERVNENYTATCQCGMPKPSGDLSKSWICKNCGNYNMGNLYECTKCGNKKFEEPIYTDWICPKCGGRNSHTNGTCTICYTPNPQNN